MQFEYATGLTGWFSHSGLLGGNRNQFHIRGTTGLIHAEPPQFTIEPKQGARRTVTLAADAGAFYGGLHAAMWQALAAAWHSGQPPRYTAAMAAQEIAVLAAVQRSLQSGSPAEVEAVS